jgi:cold shock CspA family protein
MRLVGRISGWNEDKGYGFVVPHDGGGRAFVHIKAFQFGSRRPVDGDLISYSTNRDDRGRINANGRTIRRPEDSTTQVL